MTPTREQIANIVYEVCGPLARQMPRFMFNKPYLKWIDTAHEFHVDVSLQSSHYFQEMAHLRDGTFSTIKHVRRFTIQCVELGCNNYIKLILFPN